VQEALNQARPFNAPRNSGTLPGNYRWDMRFNKDIHLSRTNEAVRLGFSVVAANLFNHTNFTGVNGIFPVGSAADPRVTAFPITDVSGNVLQTVNLLNGPYNLHGFKARDFGVPGSIPLAFNSADVSRQVVLGLRVSF